MPFKELDVEELQKDLEELRKDPVIDIQSRSRNQRYNLVKATKEIREKKGLTQRDISKATGLTQQQVSRMEFVNENPTLNNYLKYIEALGLEIKLVSKDTKINSHEDVGAVLQK